MPETHPNAILGCVTDVALHPDHGRAEVTLTIDCADGVTFTESFDGVFNQARSQNFSHMYGVGPESAKNRLVNVVPKIGPNPRHVIKLLPVATVGGDVHVPEDANLPVAV